ncbi:flagellar hook assembly protein FlgD [Roseobacter sp. HKCCA0434]|uniref:flagellar hook assembly protein FlgD n=1 Tax=Roseobacter sp. HKCCA0434 TaxID=3079297 RepID=UPI002905D6AA|nr:flagellar hook capping FlgD N-terminal domain-containing protein [Roseobacter sp. HKCCA0434]
MDIQPTHPAGTFGAPSAPSAPSLSSTSTDFQTFLTLLTTQMRNQDPLKPMESTQFVEQLATFSSVEQQVEMNLKLDALTASLTAQDAGSLAAWLDRDVAIEGQARYSGEPIVFGRQADLPPSTRLVVRDGMGDVVHDGPFDGEGWSGRLASGLEARHGDYAFELRGPVADGDILIARPAVHSRVVEARADGDGMALILADGRKVAVADITSIRN